ncbi:transmembrane protein 269 isoform X3 [Oncorhynchus tshawytscha]|uniref:transmembrane protein 269 isoform X3 n=1 Tax=Oncorhynchus tshawytscha TaxID=74940 RepID=UPI000D0A68E8|nr:transmembrane protein 269 isoform X3 [Oncorhynchus tshawytscha]
MLFYSIIFRSFQLLCCGQTDAERIMILLTPSSGFFQRTNKLFLSEQATGVQLKEFVRKNAANALSMANMLMGMASILCSLNGHQHAACWLVLIGYLLDLADGAVARRLDACSPLGAKLDDFADFTTFGIATSLLLRTHALMDNILCMCYVLSVFVRLCFFSSGIPFMYRGLPCIYSSAILACLSLLTGGNMVILRVTAVAMILFMVNQGFYPHDRVLESQAWKKVVYAGERLRDFTGSLWQERMISVHHHLAQPVEPSTKCAASRSQYCFCVQQREPSESELGVVMVFCSSFSPACVYYLLWSVSYILFPTSLWSCKV